MTRLLERGCVEDPYFLLFLLVDTLDVRLAASFLSPGLVGTVTFVLCSGCWLMGDCRTGPFEACDADIGFDLASLSEEASKFLWHGLQI